MHTDAVDVGYGGTINFEDMGRDVYGSIRIQGKCIWKDLAESISVRELRSIRFLLVGSLAKKIQ